MHTLCNGVSVTVQRQKKMTFEAAKNYLLENYRGYKKPVSQAKYTKGFRLRYTGCIKNIDQDEKRHTVGILWQRAGGN